MAVTNYYSVNNEIVGEKLAGGSRVDYLTDALGSVTATMNSSAAVVNTYRYKPYGAQLAKTGAGSDPKFTWVGNQGYRQTGNKFSDVYIRARHFEVRGARWTTLDPLGVEFGFNQYSYVYSQPTFYIDWLGMYPDVTFPRTSGRLPGDIIRGPGPGDPLPGQRLPGDPVRGPGNPVRGPIDPNPGAPPWLRPGLLCHPVLKCGLVIGLMCIPDRAGPADPCDDDPKCVEEKKKQRIREDLERACEERYLDCYSDCLNSKRRIERDCNNAKSRWNPGITPKPIPIIFDCNTIATEWVRECLQWCSNQRVRCNRHATQPNPFDIPPFVRGHRQPRFWPTPAPDPVPKKYL